ncbi:MAG TPA: DUF1003 domain-containing protein [Ferruginibacter sp.]|nr:DUF1003 domain-containing protein [Ferruginibacter sp.]HMP21602.1 DUF1003 domain-containing protein [Ferruginibacter sp.]
MKHKKVLSVEELKQNFSPAYTSSNKPESRLSSPNRLALWITNLVGSINFFFIILLWTLVWLGWNTLAPKTFRFDPYPAFVLWLFISNMIQIFLMPLIMIGQNLQSRHAENRAEEDFMINKKAEAEVETILKHLENQNELILDILKRIERLENK